MIPTVLNFQIQLNALVDIEWLFFIFFPQMVIPTEVKKEVKCRKVQQRGLGILDLVQCSLLLPPRPKDCIGDLL